MLPDFEASKIFFFCRVRRLRQYVLLVRVTGNMTASWSIAWINVTAENRDMRRNTCPSANAPTTNPTRNSSGHKGHRSERPAPIFLSQGTVTTKDHASASDYMEMRWSTAHPGSFTHDETVPYPQHRIQNSPERRFGRRLYLPRLCIP